MRALFDKEFGFSLVEVVLATGVFTGAMLGIAGLLPSLIRSGKENVEFAAAERAMHAVLFHLAQRGFGDISHLMIDAESMESITADDPRALFVNRTCDRVVDAEENTDQPADELLDRSFFQALVIRNPRLSPPDAGDRLGVVVFSIQMTWPAYLPNGSPLPRAQRNCRVIHAAVQR